MLIFKNRPSIQDFISKYSSSYPLLTDLHNTQQDHIWHAEGNVEIHTDSVLTELYDMVQSNHPDTVGLSDSDLDVLMFACAFHDYAKPITTKTDFRNGRDCIVSPNHELVASSLLINSKIPDELTWEQWLLVSKLIAYHQMPKKAVSNNFSYGQYVRLLLNSGNLKLLYILEVADMKGRVCSDQEDNITFLDLFRSECIEHNLFESDEHFKRAQTDLIKGFPEHIYNMGLSDLFNSKIHALDVADSMPYSYNKPPTLVVMCGLAGAGKSTLVGQKFKGYAIVSLDNIREKLYGNASIQGDVNEVRRAATNEMKAHFRLRQNVVYDATNYRIDFRTKVTDLGQKYGYYTKIVCISTTTDICLKNFNSRSRDVPFDVLYDQFAKFQLPSLIEAHSLEFIRGNM